MDIFKPLSILVIEDDIEIRKKIVEYLKYDHKKVYEASSETSAFDVYKNNNLDLLILDINLNQGNGLSLLRKIRENDLKIKAIVISAFSDKEYFMDAVDLKLSKYIIKPVTRKEFKSALDSVQKELSMFSTLDKSIIRITKEYYWDNNKKELFFKDDLIKLGSKENQLLELFCNNINKVLSYDEISYHLWEDIPSDKINSIKTVVKKLRKKLPKNSIDNVYALGYKITNFID